MTAIGVFRRRSLDRKLLALITGLLLATISAFSWTAYRQVERLALVSAGERLQRVSVPLEQMLAASVTRQRATVSRLAADSAIRSFLATRAGGDAALAAIARAIPDSVWSGGRMELRDVTGRVALAATPTSVAARPWISPWLDRTIAAGSMRPADVQLGPVRTIGDTSYYEVVVAIAAPNDGANDSARVIGYLTELRPVSGRGNNRTASTVRDLIGADAVMLFGSPKEGDWTDLGRPAPAPPRDARAGQSLVFDQSVRGAGVGAATAIHGTPWLLWVEQPRATVLAPTHRLVADLAALAAFFILVGAASAAVLGRRLTRPIVRLTEAAEHLAASDESVAPNDGSLDEIERLTDAFGRMAGRVHESHEALASSERRFRSLIENATDPIAILDATGVVRYASPAYAPVLGDGPASLVGRPIVERIHPDDAATASDAMRSLRKQAGKTIPLTVRLRHQDGSWRTLAGTATNLLGEPAIDGIVLNSRDVTDRLSLEAQLRHAQKMEAIGRLAGGIAHDLNNILTAVTSFSQFAAETLPSDSQAAQDIDQVQLAAERATSLTKQLLAFSRQQVLQPRALDLNEVVCGLEAMLRRLIRADIAFSARFQPSIGRVMADPAQLEQVLLNLVINAGDAMPNGGSLVIETAEVELGDEYVGQHPDAKPGPHVVLAVTDTGFGMDAETQAKIFEPFFTTKAIGKGTGLGLATVYGIVKQSGGSIWVYSEVGRGTTFKVYLPRHDGGAMEHRARSITPARASVAATVLLVEDDTGVQLAARRALESAGYTIYMAATGREALALGERLPVRPDLVITDLVMPDMGGRELAIRVTERWPGVPILFMSGYTAEAMGQQSVLTPDDAFIEKPFSPRALVEKAGLLLQSGSTRQAARSA
jgi:PAS domain S-box-containing protein